MRWNHPHRVRNVFYVESREGGYQYLDTRDNVKILLSLASFMVKTNLNEVLYLISSLSTIDELLS